MKKALFLVLLVFIALFSPKEITAVENPLEVPNNFFGIHIVNESDLEKARDLVNSSGGDWGYVTLVIREDERDTSRWQWIFNEMRQMHLIPIVRIATASENGGWRKPNPGEMDNWVSFLNSLNWVIKNRYVIIGNEPNHAKEWGGQVNPEEYAAYLVDFSQKLKQQSTDFFVLPAGLDASALYSKTTMPEDVFIRQVVKAKPDFFDHIDGWNSHSYPNPGFAGSPEATGRGTLTTFIWELEFINSLGVKKELPVFITETGWVHDQEGKVLGLENTQNIGNKFKIAFEKVWQNENVVAVTPFILNYQEGPFSFFSWLKPSGEYYDFYREVQAIPKISGSPKQITQAKVLSISTFEAGKKTFGSLVIENSGQSIWEKNELKLLQKDGSFGKANSIYGDIKPGKKAVLFLETNSDKVAILRNNEILAELVFAPKPSLKTSWQALMEFLASIW